jgi:hypothetical protein
MNRAQLRDILVREGFRMDVYDLDGGHSPECLTLARRGNVWSVYYSEHGIESGKRDFESEDSACEYFLEVLRSDPNARTKASP